MLILLGAGGHLDEHLPRQAGMAAQFMHRGRRAVHDALKHFPGERLVVGMNQLDEGFADPVGALDARNGLHGGIQQSDGPLHGEGENRVPGVFNETAVALLGPPDHALRQLAPRDVRHNAGVPDQFVSDIADLKTPDMHPADFAVRPRDAILDVQAGRVALQRREGGQHPLPIRRQNPFRP